MKVPEVFSVPLSRSHEIKSAPAPLQCVSPPHLHTYYYHAEINMHNNKYCPIFPSNSDHLHFKRQYMTSTTSNQGYFLTERQSQEGRHSYHVYKCNLSAIIPYKQMKTVKNSRWSHSWENIFFKFLMHLQTALIWRHTALIQSTCMDHTTEVVYITLKCTKASHFLQQRSGMPGQTCRQAR